MPSNATSSRVHRDISVAVATGVIKAADGLIQNKKLLEAMEAGPEELRAFIHNHMCAAGCATGVGEVTVDAMTTPHDPTPHSVQAKLRRALALRDFVQPQRCSRRTSAHQFHQKFPNPPSHRFHPEYTNLVYKE